MFMGPRSATACTNRRRTARPALLSRAACLFDFVSGDSLSYRLRSATHVEPVSKLLCVVCEKVVLFQVFADSLGRVCIMCWEVLRRDVAVELCTLVSSHLVSSKALVAVQDDDCAAFPFYTWLGVWTCVKLFYRAFWRLGSCRSG